MKQMKNSIPIGAILASLLFGVVGGLMAYQYMDMPLTYTDFIAGSITWGGEGKSKDVSIIFSFIIVTTLSLLVINKFHKWMLVRFHNDVSNHFSTVLTYAVIPFVIWIGAQVLNKGIPNYSLLYLNAWLVFGGLIATFIVVRKKSSEYNTGNICLYITLSFIIFTFSALSFNVFSVILMKAGIVERFKNAWLIIPLLWLVGLWFINNKIQYYKVSFVIFQLMIIGYFSLLLPSPFISEGKVTYFSVNTSLYLIVASLIIVGAYDIYNRAKEQVNTQELSILILSPFPLAVLLILLFLSTTSMPNVSADDYHYGEKLLPYFMLTKYHVIPYVEYSLAHGFIDMLPAIGSNLFLDGTASTIYEGNRIIRSLIVIASFLVLYRYLGVLVAFLLSLLIMPIGTWYLMAIVVSLVVLKVRAERLGYSFFLISLIIFLLAPGQGTVFIIALLPLVLYRAWCSQTIKLNLKSTAISFVIFFLISLLMPWILEMMFFAIMYVLENGSINFQAYGISWHHSWNSSRTLNSSLAVYEVVRTSWIFIPIFIFIFWLRGDYQTKENKNALFYGLFAVIFILIMHKYSLGRIDPFGFSRLGRVSKIAIPLLFISVYFLKLPKEKFSHWVLFFVLWLGLLTPNYLLNPIAHAKRAVPNIGKLTQGEQLNIPNLGTGRINKAHINRTKFIKKIVDQFLNENETFVDITNRGALYFYLERPMPIEAVPYNQAHPRMQERSVQRLLINPPPMALLKADNINHDGRSVSIRTHRLYRWVMDNYIPVSIGDIIIGVHNDKIKQFQNRLVEKKNSHKIKLPINHEEQLKLWDEIFLLKDLQQLPISWGNSKNTLNKKMLLIKTINTPPSHLHNVKTIKNGQYQVVGNDPFIVFNLSIFNLSGKDAGLLSFDFTCDGKKEPGLEIFWSADSNHITEKTVVRFKAHNGHIIVPLDAMPRWLTAKHLKNIRIDLQNKNECNNFSLKKITLNQRILNVQ